MPVLRTIILAAVLSVVPATSAKEAPFSDRVRDNLAQLIQLAYTNSLLSYDFEAHSFLTKDDAKISKTRREVMNLRDDLLRSAAPGDLINGYLTGLLDDQQIDSRENLYTQRFRKSGDQYRIDMAKGFTKIHPSNLYRTYVNSGLAHPNRRTNFYMSYSWKTLTIKGEESGPVRENALWRAFTMHEFVSGSLLYWTLDTASARSAAITGLSDVEFAERLEANPRRVVDLIDGKHSRVRPKVVTLDSFETALVQFDMLENDVSKGKHVATIELICDARDFTKIYFSGIWTMTPNRNLDAFELRSFDKQSGQVRCFAFLKRMNPKKEKLRIARILDSNLTEAPSLAVFQPSVPDGWSLIDRRGEHIREFKNGELVFEIRKDSVEHGEAPSERKEIQILIPLISGLILVWLAFAGLRRKVNAR